MLRKRETGHYNETTEQVDATSGSTGSTRSGNSKNDPTLFSFANQRSFS